MKTFAMRMYATMVVALAGLCLVGCDEEQGGDDRVCQPGEKKWCYCSNGGSGEKKCAWDGEGWGACTGCEESCQPLCDPEWGPECGPDGCGGDCGTCSSGQTCEDGFCEDVACVPDCDSAECGPDDCGGTCGTCGYGESCKSGVCKDDCQPTCSGKECGSNGCGGSCGTCSYGESCKSGICEDDCQPSCSGKECGSDKCGGQCGSCSSDEHCSSGKCLPDCECSSGPCCDGCQYEDDWTECDDLDEYQCTASCGGNVERRTGVRYCSGSSSSCTGDKEWGSWKPFVDCPDDWVCQEQSNGGACEKYTGNSAKLILKLGVTSVSQYCDGCGNVNMNMVLAYSVDCNPAYSSCSIGSLSAGDTSDTLTVSSGSTDIHYRFCSHLSSYDYNKNCCYMKQIANANCNGKPCFWGLIESRPFRFTLLA